MPTTPITNPVSGESLVGTEPQLLQQVDPGWRRRLNLFTGRALSDTALDNEQLYRSGLLTTLGQSVTAGTVNGLALTMDTSGADPLLVVTPGYGIAANGADVVLLRTLKTRLSTLAVINSVTGNEQLSFREFVGDPANATYAGILILQPVVAQVSGQTMDTGTGPVEVSGNLDASCDQDPEEYAFEDWQIADAVRLVFLPWPDGVPALPLPAKDPEATWRNRLAYAIFEAESLLGSDDQLPWAMLGLPVALIAFDPGVAWNANTAFTVGQFITDSNDNIQQVQTAGTSGGAQPAKWNTVYGGTTTDGSVTWSNNGLAWKPLFVDCSAVVRAGGLPRRRYVFPAQPPPLLQWQSGTPFELGDFILDVKGNVQKVQTAGTSGGPAPAWNTTFGQTTADGTVTWVNNGPGSWEPNTAFAPAQFIFDANGNIQQVQTAGTSGDTEPDWNGIYLPTTDGTITWINSGSGNPPIIQPPLAQARIAQLSEQLSQTMNQQAKFNTLADIFPTLPPSGILPSAALDFVNKKAPWFPRNWSLSAAPVHLEELETVLKTGMTEALLEAQTSAPTDPTLFEPVEILVPLPDAVYDPNILVTETVAPVFQTEVDKATQARNTTLQHIKTIQEELNTLFVALGPNAPANPNLIDPNTGLTPQEIQGRNTPPPFTAASTETFGTLLQTTWQPSTAYTVGQFVIDGNGTIQVLQAAGTSGAGSPTWNTNLAQTTADGLTWLNRGKAQWQPNNPYAAGQLILDANGNIQTVQTAGVSGGAAPAPWNATPGQTTQDGGVTWNNLGRSAWQASTSLSAGQAILDPNGNIQLVQIGGVSGTAQPTWNGAANATTLDAPVTWLNNGPWSWRPNTAYIAGQFVVDPNGFMQTVKTGGTSASSQPNWSRASQQTTPDGIIWASGGNAQWQPDNVYTVGQLIFDSNKNIQIVQTGGISGDSAPAWNQTSGQNTQDSGVTWTNLGHSLWQPGTSFSAGQAIIDSNQNIQLVQTGGTSGASQPAWNEGSAPGGAGTTLDAAVTWINNGLLTWQPGVAYASGQIIIDSNGNLQLVQTGGKSGATQPIWNTTPAQTTTDGTITWTYLSFYSTDLLQLKTVVGQAPYTITFTDSSNTNHTISLVSADDLTDLENNGLPHFIALLNAKISQANDLIDTAFLTVQTDIYRYRQNILGSTAASTLATSPVLANIATGETAAATATNLQSYINTVIPPAGSTTPPPTYVPPTQVPIRVLPVLTRSPFTIRAATFRPAVQAQSLRARTMAANFSTIKTTGAAANLARGGTPFIAASPTLSEGTLAAVQNARFGITTGAPIVSQSPVSGIFRLPVSGGRTIATGASTFLGAAGGFGQSIVQAGPAQIIVPDQNATATSTDITSQSPLAGAQLNLRTLTIAQRLQQSPSQEAMFYSINNRLSFLQLLEMLENDLEITADDLPILVDGAPPPAPPAGQPLAPVPLETHTFSEWLDVTKQPALALKVQSPVYTTDAPEATLFSVGVRVVEQHSMMLRALEARVQQYSDFVTLCTTALNNIQNDIQQAQVLITQLQNSLLQDRQNVAFTTALLSDEIARVNGVNAQRQQILQDSVQLIAYTRARTLEATDTAPSRQLVPANVANPVPACLQQSVSIPPELREIIGLLREAPVSWLPSVASHVNRLERPILLQQLAVSTQARAVMQLQLPMLPSSAAGEPGVYAPAISNVYSANQQAFRNLQMQRATIQPAALTNLSWSLQVATVQTVTAVNDLISAESVHTEVSNAIARLIQQICGVATCLYARISIALPVDRLAWAENLRGSGLSVHLQSLAVLPNWNQQAYIDRQQMQLLVDWLFQQIDTSNAAAMAFMSDVVRTAILLASDVPIDNIIPSNIIVRTQPTLGGVVSLNLPSDRVSSGMYVHLYSGANLAARAVVSDIDTQTVSATVTDVFTPGVYLEASDVAHLTAQTPQAVALRPFLKLS